MIPRMQNTDYQYVMQREENSEWEFMLGQFAMLYNWLRLVLPNNMALTTCHYWAHEMGLVKVEMSNKYKMHTAFLTLM